MTPEEVAAAAAAAGVCASPVQRVGEGEGASEAGPGLPRPLQLEPAAAAWQAQENEEKEGRKRGPRARYPHHLPSSCGGWLPRGPQPENEKNGREGEQERTGRIVSTFHEQPARAFAELWDIKESVC